jgi:hypothetical protein
VDKGAERPEFKPYMADRRPKYQKPPRQAVAD